METFIDILKGIIKFILAVVYASLWIGFNIAYLWMGSASQSEMYRALESIYYKFTVVHCIGAWLLFIASIKALFEISAEEKELVWLKYIPTLGIYAVIWLMMVLNWDKYICNTTNMTGGMLVAHIGYKIWVGMHTFIVSALVILSTVIRHTDIK